jgi:hypothetical protein
MGTSGVSEAGSSPIRVSTFVGHQRDIELAIDTPNRVGPSFFVRFMATAAALADEHMRLARQAAGAVSLFVPVSDRAGVSRELRSWFEGRATPQRHPEGVHCRWLVTRSGRPAEGCALPATCATGPAGRDSL